MFSNNYTLQTNGTLKFSNKPKVMENTKISNNSESYIIKFEVSNSRATIIIDNEKMKKTIL